METTFFFFYFNSYENSVAFKLCLFRILVIRYGFFWMKFMIALPKFLEIFLVSLTVNFLYLVYPSGS